jgi:hypothetical protein
MASATWLARFVIQLGPLAVTVFDVLLALAVAAFFYVVSLGTPTDAAPVNRAVLRLTGAYLLYQLVIVIPVAVAWYGIVPTEAFRSVLPRLALALIPFFYYVGLRYMKPERLVLLVNLAALGLLLYALYRYAFIGPQGSLEAGEFRLRTLWGGASLLFGWLAVVGLILQTKPLYAYCMGLAGLLGIVVVNHRSGYVALGLAALSYVILSRGVSRRLVAFAAAALIGGILLTAASPLVKESVTYSLTTMFNAHADKNSMDRVERSALAWDFVKEYPLGDYTWNQEYYLVDLGHDAFGPHNWVINALDTQGWVSAGLLFALVACVLAAGWAARRDKIGLSVTVYLVFYLAFCLFNRNFESLENISMFAIAVALVLDANRRREAAQRLDESKSGTGVREVREAAPADSIATGCGGRRQVPEDAMVGGLQRFDTRA